MPRQDAIENRPNCRTATPAEAAPYTIIAATAAAEPAAVWPGVREQPEERIHSVNRYRSSTHNATMPSRQPIFLPSS